MFSPGAIRFLLLAALTCQAVSAQTLAGSTRITFFQGDVSLNGQALQQNNGDLVAPGASLTTRGGRAEVFLIPDVYLRMGEQSSVRMVSDNPSNLSVELLAGSAVIDSTKAMSSASVTIRVRDSVTRTLAPGDYRFDFDPAQLRVYRGNAEVSANGQTALVNTPKSFPLAGAVAGQTAPALDTLLDVWSTNRRIHVSSSMSGTYETGAPRIEEPSVGPDVTTGPQTSIGYFGLTGIPQLMYIPDRPYRQGFGPYSYGYGYGYAPGFGYPYFGYSGGYRSPLRPLAPYSPLRLSPPTQFVRPAPVFRGGQVIGH
jgi:hypothetical protein